MIGKVVGSIGCFLAFQGCFAGEQVVDGTVCIESNTFLYRVVLEKEHFKTGPTLNVSFRSESPQHKILEAIYAVTNRSWMTDDSFSIRFLTTVSESIERDRALPMPPSIEDWSDEIEREYEARRGEMPQSPLGSDDSEAELEKLRVAASALNTLVEYRSSLGKTDFLEALRQYKKTIDSFGADFLSSALKCHAEMTELQRAILFLLGPDIKGELAKNETETIESALLSTYPGMTLESAIDKLGDEYEKNAGY